MRVHTYFIICFISSQKKVRALEYKFIFDKFMFEVNVIGEKNKKKLSCVFNISCYIFRKSFFMQPFQKSTSKIDFRNKSELVRNSSYFFHIRKLTSGSVYVKQKSTSRRQVNFYGSQIIFSLIRKSNFGNVCVKRKSTSGSV